MKRNNNMKKKAETEKEKAARIERNKKARANHWKKTGVSQSTINWMREGGFL